VLILILFVPALRASLDPLPQTVAILRQALLLALTLNKARQVYPFASFALSRHVFSLVLMLHLLVYVCVSLGVVGQHSPRTLAVDVVHSSFKQVQLLLVLLLLSGLSLLCCS
jgi:hypothetical protein